LLFISGVVNGNFNTQCVRCLEDATVSVKGTIEGYCKLKDKAKLPEDIGDDECAILQNDKTIDISPLVEGALVLELPLQPLCSENCKGLFEYCDHIEQNSDSKNPFSVLKNIDFSQE
jgi:uncharacterized protein